MPSGKAWASKAAPVRPAIISTPDTPCKPSAQKPERWAGSHSKGAQARPRTALHHQGQAIWPETDCTSSTVDMATAGARTRLSAVGDAGLCIACSRVWRTTVEADRKACAL